MKVKELPLNGAQYQIRRMLPVDGSYIYMRMMGVIAKAQEERRGADEAEEDARQAAQAVADISAEDRAKAFCALAMMRGLSYEDTQRLHRTALATVSRGIAEGQFVPIMTGDGRLAFDDLVDDPSLTQKLVMESLAFSLSPYFSASKAA